jgi:hypothetical protein
MTGLQMVLLAYLEPQQDGKPEQNASHLSLQGPQEVQLLTNGCVLGSLQDTRLGEACTTH